MKSRFYNSVRNFATGIFSTLVGIIIPFLARSLIIYYLGENYLGVNSVFNSIFQVINFANVGFASAIAAYLYKPLVEKNTEEVNKLLMMLTNINYALAIIVTVAGVFCLLNLDSFITTESDLNVNVTLLFLINYFDMLFGYLYKSYTPALLNAAQRNDIWCTSNTISRTIFGILQLFVIVYIRRIEMYVLLTSIVTVANRLVCFYFCNHLYPEFKPQGKVDIITKRKMLKDSFALASQKFGNLLSTSLDNIVISKFINLTAVARYSNYNYIVSAIYMLMSSLSSSILASVGYGTVTNHKDNVAYEFNMLNTFYLILAFIFSSGYLSCIQNFIYIWVGNKFLTKIQILMIASIFFFTLARSVISLFKDASANWWIDRYRPLVGGIVNLILNVILVQHIGLSGVIFSTLFSLVFVEFPWESWALFSNYSTLKIREYICTVIKLYFLMLINSTFTLIVTSGLSYSFVSLIIRGITSIIVSLCSLFIFYRNSESFKFLVSFFHSKIRLIKRS